MKHIICCILFCVFFSASYGQGDVYPGTWVMDASNLNGFSKIHLELKIAEGEKGVLFPAQLHFVAEDFNATYQFLLAKKNARELGISTQKYALQEIPYSLGKLPELLNGTFDLSRDFKGSPILSLLRLPLKSTNIVLKSDSNLTNDQRKFQKYLIQFFKEAEIQFSKQNSLPWQDDAVGALLSGSFSPRYLGLKDTIMLPTRDGQFHLQSAKKSDVASITLNGGIQLDRFELSKKLVNEEILLDTGLNIVVFFIDEFGNNLPAKAKAQFVFGKQNSFLDFNNAVDSNATFIVQKFYCAHDKNKETQFQDFIPPKNEKTASSVADKIIGNISSSSKKLTIAIWDDAVEDGDTISIQLNGTWVAKGLPVKKQPQFISLDLVAGINAIVFVAENLGSIAPNTSVIEIIDGKRRKSYLLETLIGDQNLLRINYENR
ncbi:MAG: hypothetical protein RLY16_914 [Bacteroidota bacterium]|jgi:hypothetical protein